MCCGPTKAAAALEGSKSFAKDLADAASIPTARWERFDDAEEAHKFVRRRGTPIVVKADGLAAGKGVVVAETETQALLTITEFMDAGSLGSAGRSLVIEECLYGPEVSVFALCDGLDVVPLGAAQDHKRVGDGDLGPNTGGMGAFSPTPLFTPDLAEETMARIIRPALAEMHRRGTPFRGILYTGLMLTEDGPRLIEFNARFGDPECQVILLRLKSDLLAALVAACQGELGKITVSWSDDAAIAVVMASKGYPTAPVRDTPIGTLQAAAAMPGVHVFHAATALKNGQLVSSGGRVLTICAIATDLRAAREAVYKAVDAVNWPKGFCRRDIGWRALT
jgi:phosphoribosylamine--glycine ligase